MIKEKIAFKNLKTVMKGDGIVIKDMTKDVGDYKKMILTMLIIQICILILTGCKDSKIRSQETSEKGNIESMNTKETSEKKSVMSITEQTKDVEDESSKKREEELKNPEKGKWDCIWFGNYPQSEISIENKIYHELNNISNWENDEAVLDGKKYRRVLVRNGRDTYLDEEGYKDMEFEKGYRYFIYEPIKWRILSVDGKKALLLSDKVLTSDIYSYHQNVTWETSETRSWLNGYDASVNLSKTDYSESNFLDSAFNDEEKEKIIETENINKGNPILTGEEKQTNNTIDKIFLLSLEEVCGDKAEQYGFTADGVNTKNTIRCAKATGYTCTRSIPIAHKGQIPIGDTTWWLRTSKAKVDMSGDVVSEMESWSCGVRPAIVLDLSNTSIYSYAGRLRDDE